MKRAVLEALLAAREAKRGTVLVTALADGAQSVFDEEALRTGTEPVHEAGRKALQSDRCARLEEDGGAVFIQPFNPPLRMVIVGAVHIAQPLARIASETGFEVTVVDPRSAFASEARFPGISLAGDWPDEALRKLAPDARTAIVTLTHDPKLDDPALVSALASEAFYVGSLGSRKTHAARIERLREAGCDEANIARIHGPIGLDIGARSPAEIAISIVGQIIERLRRKP